MIRLFSAKLRRIPYIERFLGEPVCYGPNFAAKQGIRSVAGWGLKKSGQRARRYAKRYGYPFLALEDGFLRSVGLGSSDPPLAIAVDDMGVYYDAGRPSRLERLIAEPLDDLKSARASALIEAWRSERVSKYNHLREYTGRLPERYVLVVDQTFGDASIEYGMAGPDSFQAMLQAALDENPECTVVLKIHPDVHAGKKRGYFDTESLKNIQRVQVLSEDVHPVGLIEHAEAVYTVTSQMGFEGLLWGKRVRTFGMPFYAGWGLTEDALEAPERRKSVALENLVHAALIAYPRYIDPETGERCEAERLIAWMGLQRRMRERFPPGLYARGFSPWKRPIVRDFFQGSQVIFLRSSEAPPSGATLVVWGRRRLPELMPSDVSLVRLEDGFLRSVGLGVDLVRPLSWVLDSQGIYYDATVPSELELLLQNGDFDEALIRRASVLREQIVKQGLTKYNVGGGQWKRPDSDKPLILVPGQVESDASIQYGTRAIASNMAMLKEVREQRPDAYVIYKPHPDVLAGLRIEGQDEHNALHWCDEVVTEVAMGELLDAVDEVHVLTSLAGFEALLRGKRVVTYGQPFYAGWGLTQDRFPLERRTRKRSLDELVAAVLIRYPSYISRTTGRFTTPERALQELMMWRESSSQKLSVWRKGLRWFLRLNKH